MRNDKRKLDKDRLKKKLWEDFVSLWNQRSDKIYTGDYDGISRHLIENNPITIGKLLSNDYVDYVSILATREEELELRNLFLEHVYPYRSYFQRRAVNKANASKPRYEKTKNLTPELIKNEYDEYYASEGKLHGGVKSVARIHEVSTKTIKKILKKNKEN